MKFSSVLATSLFALTLVAAPRPADAGDGDKILAMADKRMQQFDDQSYSATMEITKGGKVYKTLTFDMVMLGLDKQLIHFTSPGDVAGMKVLMADQDTIWTYSPEFKKVRKIAAHMQKQGFLGSHFRAEDMTLTRFGDRFDASISDRSGKLTTLSLTPKAGVQTTFTRLDLVIDASKGGVSKIVYFEGETATREQRREAWKKIDGKPMPTRVVMADLKTGDQTTINLSNIKVNQGVDEGYFSKRTLLRG